MPRSLQSGGESCLNPDKARLVEQQRPSRQSSEVWQLVTSMSLTDRVAQTPQDTNRDETAIHVHSEFETQGVTDVHHSALLLVLFCIQDIIFTQMRRSELK